MGDDKKDRTAGMIPPASITTAKSNAIPPRQVAGERRTRSARLEELIAIESHPERGRKSAPAEAGQFELLVAIELT
jgi:hypothetical protein